MNKKTFIRSLRDSLPVMAGYIIMGMGFGVLLRHSGHSFIWAPIMAITILGGSMQYVAVELLGGASFLTTAIMTIMINARYFFYGLSMLGKYRGLGFARFPLIYTLCDETFSINSVIEVPEGVERKYFYLWISLLNYSYWVTGTFLGGIFGSFITFDTTGLDFALTALFIVLFTEQMLSEENRLPGIIGVIATALCLVLFGAENLVIPSMVLILAILITGRKKICR